MKKCVKSGRCGTVDERMAGEEEKSLGLIGRLVVVLETKAHLLGGIIERTNTVTHEKFD